MSEAPTKMQPRGVIRRQAMLEAAKALFLEKGFENTSLSDIVERSKGSRSTLYELFGNKEGLLRAMVEESTTQVWEAMDWAEALPEATDEALVELGMRFAKIALSSDSMAIYRIVVAEGHRMPEIARFFFLSGPQVFHQRLTDIFRKAQEDGRFKTGDPEMMAAAFASTALGDLHFRRALAVMPEMPDDDIARFVRTMVRTFLYGVAVSRT
jgi:AcrR family transcriptional regulator